jgi:hypothetical protein
LLDINKLYTQIQSLGDYQQKRSIDIESATKTAAHQLGIAASDTDALRNKIETSKTSSLVALVTDENPAAAFDRVPYPDSYTVLSTDGSQIEPSRHNSHPAFLINIGDVSIGYNDYHGYRFNSEPKIFFRADETMVLFGDEERPVAGTVLAALRQKMEAERLSRMIEDCAGKPALALIDGTLILWTLEQRADRLGPPVTTNLKWQSFNSFMNLINTGKLSNIPIAGYISSPAASDVVNMLKVSLCPYEPVECKKCARSSQKLDDIKNDENKNDAGNTRINDIRPCAVVDGITDSSLFAYLLKDGQRSALFESRSEILDAYRKLNPFGDESVYFFYLNTGVEIARVEVPRWVAIPHISNRSTARSINTAEPVEARALDNTCKTMQAENLKQLDKTVSMVNDIGVKETLLEDALSPLDLVHAICLDQAKKGLGYPIAIAEAHEQAVVKGPDRELFHQLVERSLIQRGARVRESVKAFRKRGGLI